MYNIVEKAIYFATKAHTNQRRLRDDIEFIIHPYTVAMMVKDLGLDEKYVIGALLHDVIEDTSYTYDDIEKEFSKEIADIVLKVTEDKSIKDWKTKKEEFINRFKTEEDENIILIEICDKLHNLLFDYEKFKKYGKDIFNKGHSYEKNIWFYNTMYDVLSKKTDNKIKDRLKNMIDEFFGVGYE